MKQPTPSATDQASLSLGEQMATAIADRDAVRLRRLFATPLVFRAVTPRRFWDAETAVAVVDDVVLGTWFHPGTQVTGVTLLENDTVGDVQKVSYRMTVRRDGAEAVVEQVAYYTARDGAITEMRLVCSGFRPVPVG